MIVIVVSVFNGSQHIPLFFNSLFSQSCQAWKAIIIDDNSTDNSYSLINDFIINDNRFTLLHNSLNIGLTRSLINAISTLSNEDIVLRLDIDEIHHPRYIEEVYSRYTQSSIDFLLYTPSKYLSTLLTALPSCITLAFMLFFGNVCVHGCSSFRVHAYNSCGGYYRNALFSQDYLLWISALLYKKDILFCSQKVLSVTDLGGPSKLSNMFHIDQLIFSFLSISIVSNYIYKHFPRIPSFLHLSFIFTIFMLMLLGRIFRKFFFFLSL